MFGALGLETLNVSGMDKLRHQAKAIRDAAIGGLLQKVRYKAGVVRHGDSVGGQVVCQLEDVLRLWSGERGTWA